MGAPGVPIAFARARLRVRAAETPMSDLLRIALAAWPLAMPLSSAADTGLPRPDAHGSTGLPRPDAHAPIGVMGDHLHDAGEVMFSYRFSRMAMRDNYDGDDTLRDREVVGTPGNPGRFMVVPTSMEMDMHMIGVMFAPHDAVTTAVMVPFLRLRMDHLTRAGGRFTTESSGIGDVKAQALVRLFDTGSHEAHLNAGLSFPSGSIDEKDFLPAAGSDQRLPYPMQLGSGTWDLLPGATYKGHAGDFSWGAQALGTLRTGRNRNGYRLGDRADVTAWGAYQWTSWLSTSARLAYGWWDDIHGSDDRLNPNMVPTADPDRRDGQRLDWLLGLNLTVPFGRAGNHRLAVEYGRPFYQRLDGPQLGADWRVIAGWQSAFDWKLPGFGD